MHNNNKRAVRRDIPDLCLTCGTRNTSVMGVARSVTAWSTTSADVIRRSRKMSSLHSSVVGNEHLYYIRFSNAVSPIISCYMGRSQKLFSI